MLKHGIIPSIISNEAYNVSMAGATPIEQYYLMEDYLKNHEKPETVVMMYFIGSYNDISDFFWNRTVYFNCLRTSQFKEILSYGGLEENSYSKFLQYKLCMPNKYYAAVKNATLENRYSLNKRCYEDAEKTRGQHFFGTEEKFEPNNTSITDKKNFEILEIIEIYLNKCIEQCIENDIQVIIEQHPINFSTYANMSDGFRNEYIEYMKKLQEKYPQIIVNCDYTIKDASFFGDHSHLNPNGATVFTAELIQKYPDYLR